MIKSCWKPPNLYVWRKTQISIICYALNFRVMEKTSMISVIGFHPLSLRLRISDKKVAESKSILNIICLLQNLCLYRKFQKSSAVMNLVTNYVAEFDTKFTPCSVLHVRSRSASLQSGSDLNQLCLWLVTAAHYCGGWAQILSSWLAYVTWLIRLPNILLPLDQSSFSAAGQ